MTRRAQLRLAEDVVGPAFDPDQAQFFTPPDVAGRMAAWAAPLFADAARRAWTVRVLEPSAGSGALVQAVRALAPGASIDAVERDPRWARHLRTLACAEVHEGDYLDRPAPAHRYHLAIANPPYNGGEEGPHVAKLLDEADRIVLHLPVRSLHGVERHELAWRRIGVDWWVRREARLVRRPKYVGAGGSDEIIVLDLRRAAGPCELEWW